MKPGETMASVHPSTAHADTPPAPRPDEALRAQVAWACRILAVGGHGDFTLGHVSARGAAGVHMKRYGPGLNEVTPDDVLLIDLERQKLAGQGKIPLEVVFHTEVYRARPEVGAVVHTHPPYATALGATTAGLALLNHDAVLFKDGLPVFEETAELIVRPEQGRAVAEALGRRHAVLLRNHGVLAVGPTVPAAVFIALTLERAARIQAIATTLGPLRPMAAEMAERLYPSKYHDELIEIYWQYLIREVRRLGLDTGMPADQ